MSNLDIVLFIIAASLVFLLSVYMVFKDRYVEFTFDLKELMNVTEDTIGNHKVVYRYDYSTLTYILRVPFWDIKMRRKLRKLKEDVNA